MNHLIEIIKTWFPIACGVYYLGGIAGFIYETIFYIINNGVLTRRGSCFGPWIPIYGWGCLLMLLFLYNFRDKPWMIFILAGLVSGILEFGTGYYLYHFRNGFRAWDYNTEIWNWGNVGGYICFRSILVFALGGLVLIYGLIPMLLFLQNNMNGHAFFWLMVIPASIFFADCAYNQVLVDIFSWTSAREFYKNTGWYKIVG